MTTQYRKTSSLGMLLAWSVSAFALCVSLIPTQTFAAPVTSSLSLDAFGLDAGANYQLVNGQPTAAGGFVGAGTIGRYPEGACVPFLIRATNNSTSTGEILLSPNYSYYGGTSAIENLETVNATYSGNPVDNSNPNGIFNLDRMALTGNTLTSLTSVQGNMSGMDGGASINPTVTVTGPFSGNDNGTNPVTGADTDRHYNISINDVPSGANVNLFACARLGADANSFAGSELNVNIPNTTPAVNPVRIEASQIFDLPSLTLMKIVSTGSATPDQWSFNVTPSINGTSLFTIPTGSDSVVITSVPPESTYSITESGPAGYEFESGSGKNCVFTGSTANPSLSAGNPASNSECVFINRESPTSLTINQTIINDNGGTATAANFPLFANASSVQANVSFTTASGSYMVTQTTPAGYAVTFGGDCAADGSVSLAAGDHKVCTVINDDQKARVTVITQVTNDNSGTNMPANFTMRVQGRNENQIYSFPGSTSGTVVELNAGLYLVGQDGMTGYTAYADNGCHGDLQIGDNVVCTITNNDNNPNDVVATTGTVIIINRVTNDDGGTYQASDFDLNVTGMGPSLMTPQGSATGVEVVLNAGAYSVTQTPYLFSDGITPHNYSIVYGNECAGMITPGQIKYCDITNNDPETPFIPQPNATSSLVVIRQIRNNNGGTASPDTFTVNVNGTGVSTPVLPNEFESHVTLSAGAYDVTQTPGSGYSVAYSVGCSGTIAEGQTRICIITNDDIAGSINVITRVINDDGGTATPSDIVMRVQGENQDRIYSFPGNQNGTVVSLNGGAYMIGLDEKPGYTSYSGPSCHGVMKIGDVLDCVITLNDVVPNTQNPQPPTGNLIITKQVINDNGGTRVASDFRINVTGNSVSTSTFRASENGTGVTIGPGAFNVTESAGLFDDESIKHNYTTTYSNDCNAVLQYSVTSTFERIGQVGNKTGDQLFVKVGNFVYATDYVNNNMDVIDVTDAANPALISTTSTSDTTPSPWAIATDGNHVFVPSMYTNNLAIFTGGSANTDLTNVTNIGTTGTAALLAENNYLYQMDSEGTFRVYNYSNLSSLTSSTPVTVSTGHGAASNLTKVGNYVYVASYSQSIFAIIDVSDPMNPSKVFSVAMPGAFDVKVANGQAYVSTWLDSKIHVYNVQNPSNASLVTVVDSPTTYGSKMEIAGPLLIQSAYNSEQTMSIWDIASSSTPRWIGYVGWGNFAFSPITISDNKIYILAHTQGVRTLDIYPLPPVSSPTFHCVITNNDPEVTTATLTVIKQVINNDGRTSVASDFTLNVESTGATTSSFAGNASGTTMTINPGSYRVTENQNESYVPSFSTDCEGTIAAGETKTCTVTNNDIPANSGGGNGGGNGGGGSSGGSSGGGGGGGGLPVGSLSPGGNSGSNPLPTSNPAFPETPGRVLGEEFTAPTTTNTPAIGGGDVTLPRTGMGIVLPSLAGILFGLYLTKRKQA